jgi:Arc/MetJ-type ribon-helix-helix transcriptional regulator
MLRVNVDKSLTSFIEGQVSERGFRDSDEYVLSLIEQDKTRLQIKQRLQENYAKQDPLDSTYLDWLHNKVNLSLSDQRPAIAHSDLMSNAQQMIDCVRQLKNAG